MTTEHVERLRLRYSPDDLFDLVADVRRYPDFIDLISAMRVTREHVEDGVCLLYTSPSPRDRG